jgi:thiol:disulfide interchange protein DsbD
MRIPALRRGFAALAALLITAAAVAQVTPGLGLPKGRKAVAPPSDSASVVRASLEAPIAPIPPGEGLVVAIDLTIDPGWHIWVHETQARALPGTAVFESAIFTTLALQPSAPGLRLVGTQWPQPHTAKADVGEGPADYAVYEGSIRIFARLQAPLAEGVAEGTLTLSLQACNATSCIAPADVPLPVRIEVKAGAGMAAPPTGFDASALVGEGDGAAATGPDAAIRFDFFGAEFRIDPRGVGLLLVLLVAFAGGALLNFTPCVLPVIPLKIMSLSAAAGDRGRCLRLGAVMSAGVVCFWLGLGTLVGGISGFTAANQLFQYPAFTIVLGAFIAIMAVGMAGLFSVNLPQWVHGIEASHETPAGSFVMGMMTAVLSTPCTAPLMGAAAGWAASSGSLATVLGVFGTIGAGMASPYLLLSAFPQMARRMPRSGPASDLVKQVMGMLLLAAAAFFVGAGINGLLPSPSSVHWWVVGAIGAAAGAWLAWRTFRITERWAPRVVFGGLGAAVLAISLGVTGSLARDSGRIAWIPYSTEALQREQAAGRVVVLDFTAEWCLNCKALEHAVLDTDQVAAAIREADAAAIKVDITSRRSDGWDLLHRFERVSIPLLVVQRADGTVTLRSDAYTPDQVVNALRQARSP